MKLFQPLFLAFVVAQLPLPGLNAFNEAHAQGQEFFVFDRVEGNFKNTWNIGGTTTGFSVILDGGREVQVDLLAHQLDSQFLEGARVRVSGIYKTVEVHGRRQRILEAESVEFLEVSLSGTLQIALPGGGVKAYYSLFTTDGLAVELDLTTHNFERVAAPGIEVLVNGYYKTVRGRQIFVVQGIAIP